MEIHIYTILTFMAFHWMFDFFFQTDEMAKGKAESNTILFKHVQVYTIGLVLMAVTNISLFDSNVLMAASWVLWNAAAHYFTDYVTSRCTASLYKNKKMHAFFVVIGGDQLIHYLFLFGSFVYANQIIDKV
jgi:hypothetical protein